MVSDDVAGNCIGCFLNIEHMSLFFSKDGVIIGLIQLHKLFMLSLMSSGFKERR